MMTKIEKMDVEDLWCEDDVLFIKTKEGQVWRFEGVEVKNMDHHFEDDENVTVTRVPLTCERFKL